MKSKLLICILCFVLLCGCWDKHELEDHIFVVMMGLDKAQEDDSLLVTVAFPVTQTANGGDQDSGQYAVISAKAPTVAEAMALFGVKLAGPVSLFSTKTLVISEELARDEMLRHVLSSGQYQQMRNNTNVLISKSGAAEFIAARMENPAIDPLRQEDLLLEQANYNAYYMPMQLLDLLVNMRSDNTDAAAMYGGVAPKDEEDEDISGEDHPQENSSGSEDIKEPVRRGYLPGQVPVKSENRAQICGLAVFRGNRMVGALDSAQVQTFAMMTKSPTRKILTLPDPLSPDDNIVVSIAPTRKGRIRGYFAGDTPTFDIEVNLRTSIEYIRDDADYEQDFLAHYIRQTCEQNMRELVATLQKEYGADLLGLGNKLVRNFLTVQKWEAFNWRERYEGAEINIHVNVRLERTDM